MRRDWNIDGGIRKDIGKADSQIDCPILTRLRERMVTKER
jgi:hypothetical protein